MKKLVALLLMFCILLTLPFCGSAFAEEDDDDDFITESMAVQPPDKWLYTVGETPDYTGGSILYTAINEVEYALKPHCSGLDTSTPGVKTVTVTFNDLVDYFTVLVLRADEPITAMKDISYKHWSYAYFGPCMKIEFFTGDDQSRVNPDKPITRAEMAQIIYRAWKSDPTVMVEDSPNAAEPFTDVKKGEWWYEAIEACRKAGILRGMGDGLCQPNAPITREDAVLMLMRIRYTDQELLAVNVNQQIAASGIQPTDFRSVSSYARAAMALALGDIIFGNDQNAIRPRQSITRAECAAIFYRMFLKDYEWIAPPIPEEPEEPDEPEEPVLPLIYLSPSNQIYNSYATGNTTEGEQMTRVANKVKELLLAKGYRVFVANVNTSIDVRPIEAATMGADLYIPIHSNAGGSQTGTYVFYNGSIPGCKEFSREIFDRVAALTGTPYSTDRHKEDYLSLLPNGAPFKEVKNPTMPMAYIEVEFHDKVKTARWIIDHTDAIAAAIADGVVAYSEKYLIK